MFQKCTLISSLIVFSLSVFWLGHLYNQKPAPKLSHEGHMSKTALSGKQLRKQVRKDIWITHSNEERLHNRIESEGSTLCFEPKGDSVDVVENLTGVKCWIQEKIQDTGQNSFQQVRFFLAEEGVYSYRKQHFSASDVLLSLYRIPGTTLSENLSAYRPFLKGKAEEVTFCLENGTPQFKASQFKASSQGKSQ